VGNISGPERGEYLWPQPWGIIMALNQSDVGNISGPRQEFSTLQIFLFLQFFFLSPKTEKNVPRLILE
jgi:hypothetical protein